MRSSVFKEIAQESKKLPECFSRLSVDLLLALLSSCRINPIVPLKDACFIYLDPSVWCGVGRIRCTRKSKNLNLPQTFFPALLIQSHHDTFNIGVILCKLVA